MTPSKPKTAITVGIGVAPKGRSPLPSASKNPFDDLLSGKNDTSDPMMAGQKENVLGGDTGAKASRDDAGYIAQGAWCGACQNYTRESKECTKVEGTFKTGDSCKTYFEPLPGHEDDSGEEDGLLAGLAGAGAGKGNGPAPTTSI